MADRTNSDSTAAAVASRSAYLSMAEPNDRSGQNRTDSYRRSAALVARPAYPHMATATFEATLRTLIGDFIHDAIRRELSRTGRAGLTAGSIYSTEPSAWPPGARSRRSARDRIRAVPGHEQIGQGKATVWSVSAEAYQAHHARHVAPVTTSTATDEELAERALATSGLRRTRKAGAR